MKAETLCCDIVYESLSSNRKNLKCAIRIPCYEKCGSVIFTVRGGADILHGRDQKCIHDFGRNT